MIQLEDIVQHSRYPSYIDDAEYIIVTTNDSDYIKTAVNKQLLRVSINSGEVNFPSYGEGEHGYMRLNALYQWTFTPAPGSPFQTAFNTGCISITRASEVLFRTYVKEREIAQAQV